MAKKKQKFKRTDFAKYSKLGVRRKKKQVYRKAKGTDNKIRLKMKGHVRNVNIGFKGEKKKQGMINELKPILIHNMKDLKSVSKEQIGIIAKIGNKKRKEIAEYALKNHIKLIINPKTILNKIEKKQKKAQESKKQRIAKRMIKDKKAQKEAEKKAKEQAKKEKKEEEKESIASQESSENKISKVTESSSEKPRTDTEKKDNKENVKEKKWT